MQPQPRCHPFLCVYDLRLCINVKVEKLTMWTFTHYAQTGLNKNRQNQTGLDKTRPDHTWIRFLQRIGSVVTLQYYSTCLVLQYLFSTIVPIQYYSTCVVLQYYTGTFYSVAGQWSHYRGTSTTSIRDSPLPVNPMYVQSVRRQYQCQLCVVRWQSSILSNPYPTIKLCVGSNQFGIIQNY